jgi:hypothetical protein
MKLFLTIFLLGLTLLVSAETYATQSCNANIIKNKPSSLYTDNANGTVNDNKTNLMWQKCSLGQTYSAGNCTGVAITATWEMALKSASTDTKYNYTDWRVPNKNELASLVESACYFPAINEGIFPVTPNAIFWTASPTSSFTNFTWTVSFDYGVVGPSLKENSNYVRLVRNSK